MLKFSRENFENFKTFSVTVSFVGTFPIVVNITNWSFFRYLVQKRRDSFCLGKTNAAYAQNSCCSPKLWGLYAGHNGNHSGVHRSPREIRSLKFKLSMNVFFRSNQVECRIQRRIRYIAINEIELDISLLLECNKIKTISFILELPFLNSKRQ